MQNLKTDDRVVIRTPLERLAQWDGVTGRIVEWWGSTPVVKPDKPRPDGNGLLPFGWVAEELHPAPPGWDWVYGISGRDLAQNDKPLAHFVFHNGGISVAQAVENVRRNLARYVAADQAATLRLFDNLTPFGVEPVSFGFKTEDESCEGSAPLGMPEELADLIEEASDDALDECDRQFDKWGDQRHKSLFEWVSILTEEVGEFAQAVNDGAPDQAEHEAVQIAGTAISILAAMRSVQ